LLAVVSGRFTANDVGVDHPGNLDALPASPGRCATHEFLTPRIRLAAAPSPAARMSAALVFVGACLLAAFRDRPLTQQPPTAREARFANNVRWTGRDAS